MSAWTPAGEGPALTELSPTLSALAPFRDQVIVPTGLSQRMAESMGDGNGEHSRGQTVWLSGVHPKRTEGADVESGVTVDQIAAQALGKDTPLLSIEMALEQNYLVGNCDNGYSCVYWNTISWRTPTTPLPMENNPRNVFERLFGASDSTGQATDGFMSVGVFYNGSADLLILVRKDTLQYGIGRVPGTVPEIAHE